MEIVNMLIDEGQRDKIKGALKRHPRLVQLFGNGAGLISALNAGIYRLAVIQQQVADFLSGYREPEPFNWGERGDPDADCLDANRAAARAQLVAFGANPELADDCQVREELVQRVLFILRNDAADGRILYSQALGLVPGWEQLFAATTIQATSSIARDGAYQVINCSGAYAADRYAQREAVDEHQAWVNRMLEAVA